MIPGYDWEKKFSDEIQRAEIARSKGNEGMARVCARRAAGIAIEEYLDKTANKFESNSTLAKLEYINSLPIIPDNIKKTISDLLIHVTPEHTHPRNSDLVSEARKLREELMILVK